MIIFCHDKPNYNFEVFKYSRIKEISITDDMDGWEIWLARCLLLMVGNGNMVLGQGRHQNLFYTYSFQCSF